MPKDVSDACLAPLRRPESRRERTRAIRSVRTRYLLEAAERLRAFDKPALIVWPPEDPVFLFEHAKRLAELLPNATLVEVEDSWGFVSEDRPDVLAREIGLFLDKTSH